MKNKFTQEYVDNYFKEQGYTLLSEYKGARSRVTIRNQQGEDFSVEFARFRAGARPDKSNRKRYDQDMVVSILKEQGYTLHSTYRESLAKMDVTCQNGHTWQVRLSNFLRGSRCPECNVLKGIGHMSMGERLVFAILQHNKVFKDINRETVVYIDNIQHRFDFTFTYNNQPYALEYDGEQHYGNNSWWPDPTDKDKQKDSYCKQNNITLIRVTYKYNTIPSVTQYLGKELNITLQEPKTPYNPTVQDVVNYYMNHSLSETMDKFHIGENTITKYFKSVYGMTKSKYMKKQGYALNRTSKVKLEIMEKVANYYLTHDVEETSCKFSINKPIVFRYFDTVYGTSKRKYLRQQQKPKDVEVKSETLKSDLKEGGLMRMATAYYLAHTVEETLSKFPISAYSLKAYFKGVYGMDKKKYLKQQVYLYNKGMKYNKEVYSNM